MLLCSRDMTESLSSFYLAAADLAAPGDEKYSEHIHSRIQYYIRALNRKESHLHFQSG